ncbi:MAG TPA: hypothetical protein VGC61_00600 [Pyrinomonadaceae bacterium]|jgi:hypothetical protein
MRSDPPATSCYDASMPGEENNNLINFIATTVEALRDQMATMREQMATKVDLANLKDEIATIKEQMATKDDLAQLEHRLRAEMATKDELAQMEHRLREEMATKDDLALLGTVVRGDFEQVHFRFDALERVMSTRFGQVETDISRIRSVLYLLVKDKPDMLRLLGQPTPGESRPQS